MTRKSLSLSVSLRYITDDGGAGVAILVVVTVVVATMMVVKEKKKKSRCLSPPMYFHILLKIHIQVYGMKDIFKTFFFFFYV